MYKGIVLLTSQRSGSTMVCDDMWLTESLGYPEEYFISWIGANNNKHDWRVILDKLMKNKVTKNGVFSIKVMADQMDEVGEKLIYSGIDADDPESAFHQVFSDFLFVRIWRKDKVRQAVSQAMAKSTGICHATASADQDHFAGKLMKGYDSSYNSQVPFRRDLVAKYLGKINQDEHKLNRFIQRFNIQPIRVNYEDAVSDRGYLKVIAEKMGVVIDSEIPPRRLVPLANFINEEWCRKWRELER